MALRTRAIRQKITSVRNIRKITKAMEMVAVSKMRRAVSSALATREYSAHALVVLQAIARERNETHPLLSPGTGDRTLYVVIASNRGLCGGFNVALSKAVLRHVAEAGAFSRADFVTVGKNADRIARKISGSLKGSFEEFSMEQGIWSVGGLSRLVIDEFLSGAYSRVVLCYNRYVSAIRYESVIRVLLPVQPSVFFQKTRLDAERLPRAPYLFEPAEEEVLAEILPRLVEVDLYQANLESVASEQSARMVAMRNASESAGEMITELTLDFNHARQDGITQEISEIAAGAEALGAA